jgi:hypothetical protein
MTSDIFYKLVLALWGEDWRPRLLAFLAEHGHSYKRQSLWNWQNGKSPVPKPVAVILDAEAKRQGVQQQKVGARTAPPTNLKGFTS